MFQYVATFIGMLPCRRTLADLITSLEEAQAAGRLQARLKVLNHPAVLVVDEIRYLPITRTGAMLFFQLITRRYQHASPCSRPTRVPGVGRDLCDDVMAAALIDRLVQHGHLVTIRGNSYRMRQHSEAWQTLHTGSSGGYDDLRLVPSSICQIFTRS